MPRFTSRILNLLAKLGRSKSPQGPSWPGRLIQSFLFVGGLVAWGWFLNWGHIPFDFHDWSEITAPRLAFLQDAVTRLLLPLHMPDPRALKLVTDRFLSVPDQILSPQVFLLRWLDLGQFALAQVWLCYAAGFWGIIRLGRKLNFSVLAFTILFLLFNFNGHVVSHLAIGHLTFAGTLLFPWFILLVVKLNSATTAWKWSMQVSLFLVLLLLQGSFHQVFWCFLFLAILALVIQSHFWTILKATIFAFFLCSFRLFPCLLLAGSFETEFQGGFPALLTLWQGLTGLQFPGFQIISPYTWRLIGWWEFDFYIGLVGTIFLVFFPLSGWSFTKRDHETYPGRLIIPSFIMLVLSIGGFYEILNISPLPLADAERLTSRLAVLPFYSFLVLAAFGLQSWLDQHSYDDWRRLLVGPGLLLLAHDLWQHLTAWRVPSAFLAFTPEKAPLQMGIVSNHPDPSYQIALLLGAAVSLLSFTLLIFLNIQERKTRRAYVRLTLGGGPPGDAEEPKARRSAAFRR